MKNKTTEEFIIEAKNIHGNKYDYSKVEYIHSQRKVIIICPIHGEFKQTPNNHIYKKRGCDWCSNNHRYTTQEWIIVANEKHKNKYDYSKVIYKNSKTKICIICPEHGEFWQEPASHLMGCGCQKCANRQHWITRGKTTTEEFIEKAIKIHNDIYDYSKVKYINCTTKICIICSEHGEFWQTPEHHIKRKYGCPFCKKSKLEKYVRLFLEKHGIIFHQSFREFEWLRNHPKNKLELDFYLPEYNIAIECQGIQHFFPVKYFDKKNDTFGNRKNRDNIKKNMCKKNNVFLYYINYDDNIEVKLNNILGFQ